MARRHETPPPARAALLYVVAHAAATALVSLASTGHPFFEWCALCAVSIATYCEAVLARRARHFAPLLAGWVVALLLEAVWRAHWTHHEAMRDLAHPVWRAALGLVLYALALALGAPYTLRPDLAPVLVGAAFVLRLLLPPPPAADLALSVAQSVASDCVAASFCIYTIVVRNVGALEARDVEAGGSDAVGGGDAARTFRRYAPLACVAQCGWVYCAESFFMLAVGALLQIAFVAIYAARAFGSGALAEAALLGRRESDRAHTRTRTSTRERSRERAHAGAHAGAQASTRAPSPIQESARRAEPQLVTLQQPQPAQPSSTVAEQRFSTPPPQADARPQPIIGRALRTPARAPAIVKSSKPLREMTPLERAAHLEALERAERERERKQAPR